MLCTKSAYYPPRCSSFEGSKLNENLPRRFLMIDFLTLIFWLQFCVHVEVPEIGM